MGHSLSSYFSLVIFPVPPVRKQELHRGDLREPAKDETQNRPLTDQQVSNLLHHLKPCHGVSREEVNTGHLTVETSPFPGTLIPFVVQVITGTGMYLEEPFLADRCQYRSVPRDNS